MDVALGLPPASPRSAVAGSVHTWLFLAAFFSLAAVFGIRSIWQHEASGLDLLVSISLAGCLTWWTIVDAKKRRHPVPLLAREWLFFFAPLLVPGYVVLSRGWRGIGWLLLNALLWILLATTAMHAGGHAIYGDAWWPALGR